MEDRPETFLDQGLRWIFHAVTGLIATTLVASLATAPFAAYHFQTLNPYGLVGNALALPLVSLVVMPAAVLGVLSYPLGLDGPVWRLMGWAVARVLEVSGWVGGIGGSTLVVPALSAGALGLLSLALLTVALSISSLRWLALLPAGIGVALAAYPSRFDIYIDREGAGAAIRSAGGQLSLVGRPSSFVVEQWLRADGDARAADDPTLRRDARCDPQGCVVEMRAGRHVAYVQDVAAFEEDCRRASVVVTRLKAPPGCDAILLVDREALVARGATAIRLAPEAIDVRSVRRGSETIAWTERRTARIAGAPNENGPRRARPVPEQDLPEEDFSSGEPD